MDGLVCGGWSQVLEHLGRQPFRFDELERHGSVGNQITGQIDHSRSAASELSEDLVAARNEQGFWSGYRRVSQATYPTTSGDRATALGLSARTQSDLGPASNCR